MRALSILILIIFVVLTSFGQTETDSITCIKTPRAGFLRNGKELTFKDIQTITQSVPEAVKEIQIAKSNQGFAVVLSYAGGFLVGWPIGTFIGGGKPNWKMAGVGLGMCLLTIPLNRTFIKHTRLAVDAYNASLRNTVAIERTWQIGLSQNGVGVSLKF